MSTEMTKTNFSVLLAYPDYVAHGPLSECVYMSHVSAYSVQEAVTLARVEAEQANKPEPNEDGDDEPWVEADDFEVIAVFAGFVTTLH